MFVLLFFESRSLYLFARVLEPVVARGFTYGGEPERTSFREEPVRFSSAVPWYHRPIMCER